MAEPWTLDNQSAEDAQDRAIRKYLPLGQTLGAIPGDLPLSVPFTEEWANPES